MHDTRPQEGSGKPLEAGSLESLILPIKGSYYEKAGRKNRRRLLPNQVLELAAVTGDEEAQWEDFNAVEVKKGTERIGWIPRTHSGIVRQLLEQNLIRSVTVWRVGTNERMRWQASLCIEYTRGFTEKERLLSIKKRMLVPNDEYASMIAASTKEGSSEESDWIEVYNDTVFSEE